ncbi:MAG: FAD-dependent oxidoreductase, partial [Clostridia bacterium]
MANIVVIGSGVIGSSIARELSRYDAHIVVLEKGNDVSVGTSKANSGIVHAGHDAKTGSLKAKFNVAGNAMFDDLSKELDFPFRRNGSLVLCFDKAEEGNLTELFSKGVANGVRGMSIISGDEVRKIEPSVSDKVTSALLVPSGGIV